MEYGKSEKTVWYENKRKKSPKSGPRKTVVGDMQKYDEGFDRIFKKDK